MNEEERKAWEEALRDAANEKVWVPVRKTTILSAAAELKQLREDNERLQKLWDLDRTAKEHFMRRARTRLDHMYHVCNLSPKEIGEADKDIFGTIGPCAHEKEAKRLREISKDLALKALTVNAVSVYLVEAVEAAKRYREIVGIGRKPEDGAKRAIDDFDEAYLAYREMIEKPEEKPCLNCRKYTVIPGGFCPGCGAGW